MSRFFAVMAVVVATFVIPVDRTRASLVNNFDGTFTDTATGIQWMDLFTTYSIQVSDFSALLAANPGFQFATEAQVVTLTEHTGITSSTTMTDFLAIATAMDALPQPTLNNRFLIWGYYGDGTKWAFTYGPAAPFVPGWEFQLASPLSSPDLGAFLVKTSSLSETPLPAALPLFAGGFGLIGLLARRKKQRHATQLA